MLMSLTQSSGGFSLTEIQDYVSAWKLQTTFIVNSWEKKKKKPQACKLLHLSVKNLSSDVQSDIDKNI